MAPPLPPPGRARTCGGLAPLPMAWLSVNRLLRIVHETPMLEIPPPFEQAFAETSRPPKVLLTT